MEKFHIHRSAECRGEFAGTLAEHRKQVHDDVSWDEFDVGAVVHDAETYRLKALAYAKLVEEATSKTTRDHLLRMERSYHLLAKNADWLKRTAAFLREENKRRWSSDRHAG